MKKERFFRYLGTSTLSTEQRCFTKGSVYRLEGESGGDLVFIDDEGDNHEINRKHFKELTDEVSETREQKIARLEKELDELKNAFEVGDYVVLPSKRPKGWNLSGKMDESLGKIVKIVDINRHKKSFTFSGSSGWQYLLEEIERHATSEEIKELEEIKLPKIGCREGIKDRSSVIYGDKQLSKSTLLEMEEAGIISLVVKHDDDTFNITVDMLKQIYKVAKK